jgi:hypothetical protein
MTSKPTPLASTRLPPIKSGYDKASATGWFAAYPRCRMTAARWPIQLTTGDTLGSPGQHDAWHGAR